MAKINDDIQNIVARHIYDNEYSPARSARDDTDFESTVDMLECIRNEKDYEWMSDIFFPYLVGIISTEASEWAQKDFQTRDFVEVKLDGTGPTDQYKCEAAKRCINQTLNRKALYYFQKHIRRKLISVLNGQAYAVCWWEQETEPTITGYEDKIEDDVIDIFGSPVTSKDQIPKQIKVKTPVYGEKILYDHFNFEPIDPRNVFTNNRYCYSVQDKDWVIIRTEKTYDDLKRVEKKNGYFNLDKVKEALKAQGPTETSQDKMESNTFDPKAIIKPFDVLLRFGKFWATWKEKEGQEPTEINPGYDETGEILAKAELVSSIIEEAVVGNQKILIRFQPNPYKDSRGNSYIPVVRGLCYIHPTKDSGLSDGKILKELQIAINDNFNMGADRTKLATLPTLKGDKLAVEGNETIYFEPEHVIEVEGGVANLEEFKIDDNIEGCLATHKMLSDAGHTAVAVYPTTMGQLPELSSTTATAVAGSQIQGNIRSNYKSLTDEFTFSVEFYWIILQMTYQFARAETAMKMMGDMARYFDADADYTYSPVTSNIELEYNKNKKISNYDQTIGRLSGLVQVVPDILPIIAHMLRRQLELQGDEYAQIAQMINKLTNAKVMTQEGMPQQQGQPPDVNEPEGSNQYMRPQSIMERMARERLGYG